MILLDTQVWVWWSTQASGLTSALRGTLERHEADGLGVSAISVWEVAKKVEIGKLDLGMDLTRWLDFAVVAPGVRMLDLTREVLVEATRLPPPFHRDPADQIVVATARIKGLAVLTTDRKINSYPHVEKVDRGV